MDRRSGDIRDARAVRVKFGVDPEYIADYLALVGDASDGYPGLPGIGPKTAARLINQHGHLEQFPPDILHENRERALLFKTLATLRTNEPLFANVDELRWNGPAADFGSMAARIEGQKLAERVAILKRL
jgi:5'-3' exonuclease